MTDTGPPYPASPSSGSNAIGEFEVGVSQVGDITLFDWRSTVLSQYSNSPIITQLIQNFDSYVDQTANLDAFFDLIFNLDTAQGPGLDVWGRIVGVKRTLAVQNASFFGFAESLPGTLSWNDTAATFAPALGFAEATDAHAFGEGVFNLHASFAPGADGGIFYSGVSLTQNYNLVDQSYRQLIFAKAAANITNGSIPSINQILLSIFPNRGNCYVSEGTTVMGSWFGFSEAENCQPFGQAAFYDGVGVPTGMSLTYNFNFHLSPLEYAIVAESGVLPKSTGVAASISSY